MLKNIFRLSVLMLVGSSLLNSAEARHNQAAKTKLLIPPPERSTVTLGLHPSGVLATARRCYEGCVRELQGKSVTNARRT